MKCGNLDWGARPSIFHADTERRVRRLCSASTERLYYTKSHLDTPQMKRSVADCGELEAKLFYDSSFGFSVCHPGALSREPVVLSTLGKYLVL